MSEAPEAPLKAPDENEQPEAALRAPDEPKQAAQAEQTGQEAPFRLGSLGEETPAVEPAGFPDLGPDFGAGAAPEGTGPRPEPPLKGAGQRVDARALDIRLLSDIPLEV